METELVIDRLVADYKVAQTDGASMK